MSYKVWPISDNIQCQQLTAEYLEETLDIVETAFFPHENMCKTLRISEDPEAVLELRELSRCAALDGVSVIAVDKRTNKVIGASLNKIQVKDDQAYANFFKNWKRPASKALIELMYTLESKCNLFDVCETDCLLEFMFLTALPEYRGLGIGKMFVETSLEIARNLLHGTNAKISVDSRELSLEPVPKYAISILTTFISQKLARRVGTKAITAINYCDFKFHGLDFTEIIKSGSKQMTLEYLKI